MEGEGKCEGDGRWMKKGEQVDMQKNEKEKGVENR